MTKTMKRIERIVSIMLVAFVMLSLVPLQNNTVHAATPISVLSTTYDRPDPSKYYTKYYYKNDDGEWTWKWSKAITEGKMHKYVINRSDTSQQWAYCIEPDKAMGTGYDPVAADEEDYWNALTSSQRVGISLALKFGLEHNKYPAYGYTSKESTAAYIATQCLVWEFKDGLRKTSDFSLNTVTNSAGETRVPKYTYYNVAKQNDTCFEIYQSILSAIKKYYAGASFTSKSSADARANPVVLKWNPVDKNYSVTLTDSNKCGMKKAGLVDGLGENYTVTRNSNKYTITRIVTGAATKTVSMPNYDSDLLDNRGGEVQKIWTNSLKQPLMTGASNPVNLYVTFATEDTGYLKIIKKVSGAPSDEAIDYTKFKFTIKDVDGKTVYTGYPDSSGALKVKLAVGNYTVSEVLTSAQSKKYEAPTEKKVKITANHTSSAPLESTFTNKYRDVPLPMVKVKLVINKIMEKSDMDETGNRDEVKNVIFGLYAKEDLTFGGDTMVRAGTLMETIPLENEGENTFETELPVGNFYVKELDTDWHYIIDEKEYHFTVSKPTSDTTYTIKINSGKTIENKLDLGEIKLKKTDLVTSEPVTGALYGLFAENEKEFSEATALMTGTTENGELTFSNVVKASYQIKELVSPDGYLINDNIILVDVIKGQKPTYVETSDEPYEIITSQSFEMPHTGSTGSTILSVTGSVLILLGLWLLANRVLQ